MLSPQTSTPFARSQANCFSPASRLGMLNATWLIATGWSNIDHSAGGFGKFGFSHSAMSWW
jgi:hypothetical protein